MKYCRCGYFLAPVGISMYDCMERYIAGHGHCERSMDRGTRFDLWQTRYNVKNFTCCQHE